MAIVAFLGADPAAPNPNTGKSTGVGSADRGIAKVDLLWPVVSSMTYRVPPGPTEGSLWFLANRILPAIL